jgi:cytochrome c oxidase subunit 3
MKQIQIVGDYAELPTYRFSYRAPLWWGTLSYVVIEGLGFVFGIVIYFYLQSQNADWPFGNKPGLLWPTALTILLLLSEIPNTWTKRAAVAQDLRRVRIGVIVMAIIGIVAIAMRIMEFTTLGIRWDTNAFGSTLWLLIGLHTAHLVTDVFETFVIVFLLFRGPIDARRLSEAEDNQAYWDFVVLAWIPVYFTMYWAPRLLGGSSA